MKTPKTEIFRTIGISLVFTCAGLLCTAANARAQTGRLQINHLEKLADKAAEVVDVNLDGPLLQLASKFMSDKRDPDEAAAKDFIQHLQGIYVKSFEFDKEGEYSQADVDEIRKQLRPPTWQRTVEVRSKRQGDNAEIYLMTSGGDAIKGLAILCADPKELTVVNIVGPINLDKLAELDGEMGMPRLGLVHAGKDKKETKDGKDAKDGKDTKEATRHDQTK
jgi:Domain of unknown function (DUF4252)